jgi:hypothetical protein
MLLETSSSLELAVITVNQPTIDQGFCIHYLNLGTVSVLSYRGGMMSQDGGLALL